MTLTDEKALLEEIYEVHALTSEVRDPAIYLLGVQAWTAMVQVRDNEVKAQA
jgi:hypothetical protein